MLLPCKVEDKTEGSQSVLISHNFDEMFFERAVLKRKPNLNIPVYIRGSENF